MLELNRQTGQLTNLNLRAEKHGEENVSGADIKVAMKVSNDMLSEFHQSLKSAFYRAPHAGEMDMVDNAQAQEGTLPLNRLQFGNKIGGIKWNEDFVGVIATVHFGTGGKSDIVLDDTTVDNFGFEFMEGGSVLIVFRIKCVPDEKQIGKLAGLIGNEIEFSLKSPDADAIDSE